MNFGNEIPTDSETARGRNWPCLRQFGLLLENRVGSLHDLMRRLERDDLRVIALSIVDSIDCAVARLILSHYERGLELLQLSDYRFFESDVIGVELPDHPQPHVAICTALLQSEINIHYTYPLLYRRAGRDAIALYVDDVDRGLSIMNDKGLRIVTEADLEQDDNYFLG